MLFGYDMGISSAVLVYTRTDLGSELQANEKDLLLLFVLVEHSLEPLSLALQLIDMVGREQVYAA